MNVPARFWFAVFLIGVIALAIVVGIVGHLMASTVRRIRWPHEQERRAGLQRLVAQIVKRTRVTPMHRQYTLRVVPSDANPYRARQNAMTFRATLAFSKQVRRHARETGTLPVLFDPSRPTELIVDFVALGEPEEARKRYVSLANGEWTLLADSD